MSGRVCLWQVLNAEGANLSKMFLFKIGRFSLVGAHERTGLSVGGKLRVGQLHGGVPGWSTPVLVHFCGV